MAQTYFTLLTTHGFAAITNALALGQTVSITQMGVGDGNGNAVAPDEKQLELVHETYRGQLNEISRPNDAQILAEFVIPAAEGGYTIREVGLYDAAGNLLAVANFPATYKPSPDDGTTSDLVIRMLVNVGNASVVNVTLDPSAVIATRQWVLENIPLATVFPGGHRGQVIWKTGDDDGAAIWKMLTAEDIDGLDVALSRFSKVTHDTTNVTPVDGAHGIATVPTFVGSAYYSGYGVPQATRRFQVIASGGDFGATLYEGTSPPSGGNPTLSHTIAIALDISTPYSWRYRDETVIGECSDWSAPTDFTTATIYVQSPAVVSPANGAHDVGEQPVITLSEFEVVGAVDTLASISLRVRDSSGTIVWKVINQASPSNDVKMPAGILQPGNQTYTIEGRQTGVGVGASVWSAQSTFVTSATFDLLGSYERLSGGAADRWYATAAAIDGAVYMFGGYSGSGTTNYSDLWRYDPSTDSWGQLTSCPVALWGHSAVAIAGKMYVFGGTASGAHGGGGGVDDAMWCYDPGADAWNELASIPANRSQHSAVVIANKMYVFGGRSGVNDKKDLWCYDPATDEWTQLAPGSTARADHSAVAIAGKMYVFGGEVGGVGGTKLNDLWCYDPGVGTWQQLSPASLTRYGHIAVEINQKMYVFGGWVSSGQRNDLWYYDPATDEWMQLASGATKRYQHAAAAIDGRMYVYGGSSGSGTLNDLWVIS